MMNTAPGASHVVLALNNSDHSKYAFEWAIKNLLHLPTHRVTILTVVEPPIQAGYYYAASAGKPCIPFDGMLMLVAMYSPAFIDDVYKKAQEDATALVRSYQAQLEKHFEVLMHKVNDLLMECRARCHARWSWAVVRLVMRLSTLSTPARLTC